MCIWGNDGFIKMIVSFCDGMTCLSQSTGCVQNISVHSWRVVFVFILLIVLPFTSRGHNGFHCYSASTFLNLSDKRWRLGHFGLHMRELCAMVSFMLKHFEQLFLLDGFINVKKKCNNWTEEAVCIQSLFPKWKQETRFGHTQCVSNQDKYISLHMHPSHCHRYILPFFHFLCFFNFWHII